MSQSAEWWRDYRARNRERLNRQQRERRVIGPDDLDAVLAVITGRAIPASLARQLGNAAIARAPWSRTTQDEL